ncbi:MAG: TrmH family RNA methyltransferase [bacterium]|jgi:TrmH family RNA methyltransferase
MSNQFKNITIVLVEPAYAGNIGAVVRAMDNMGVSRLKLVKPCNHLATEGIMFASNSLHLLEKAEVFSSLEEALEEHELVIGTSARFRNRRTEVTKIWDLQEIQELQTQSLSTAFVFGRERIGLTNEEMDLCNDWVTIPTFGDNTSLNLAQSVMVILYEYSKQFHQKIPNPYQENTQPLAPSSEVEETKKHLFRILEAINFIKEGKRPTIWSNFSDLVARCRMTEKDTRLLRGFFNRVEIALGTKPPRKSSK